MFTNDHVPMFVSAKWTTNDKLLSIGVLSVSGAVFYAEGSDHFITDEMSQDKSSDFHKCQWNHMNQYVCSQDMTESVFGYDVTDPHTHYLFKGTTESIGRELRGWMSSENFRCSGGKRPIQIYTDTDVPNQYMVYQLLSKKDGLRHNNVRDQFIDLGTMFLAHGYGYDVKRNTFIDTMDRTSEIKRSYPWNEFDATKLTGTALWEATRIRLCFERIIGQFDNVFVKVAKNDGVSVHHPSGKIELGVDLDGNPMYLEEH